MIYIRDSKTKKKYALKALLNKTITREIVKQSCLARYELLIKHIFKMVRLLTKKGKG